MTNFKVLNDLIAKANKAMGRVEESKTLTTNNCKPNLTVDIAGWQGTVRDNYHEFCSTLRLCLDEFTSERVLFGTDNPYMRAILPDKKFVNIIKRLPAKAPEGIKFTQEEVDLILGGNAQRIFGIS